jgi:pyruvate dehydrogenase E1 component alpha subunit
MSVDVAATVRGVPLAVAVTMLKEMCRSRALEDRLHALYRQGRLHGRLLSGRGQEAIPVGAALALEPDDRVAPLHRDLGVHLVRGTTYRTILLHYFGKAAGPARGRDGDIHFGEWGRGVFPMVSHLPDSFPVALGFALAARLRGWSRVALAICGDGATSTGLWHETLNMGVGAACAGRVPGREQPVCLLHSRPAAVPSRPAVGAGGRTPEQ